jgi:hypothetical protein
MCRNCLLNRREFVETMGVRAAGTFLTSRVALAGNTGVLPDPTMLQWAPDAAMFHPCKTHYESDFGASPTVDFPIGQKVTFLAPHSKLHTLNNDTQRTHHGRVAARSS